MAFGKRFADLRFGSPQHKLLAELHYSAATFAAYKNHRMISDLLLAKKNEGSLKAAGRRIDKQYNELWLSAEQRTARLQSIGARKWLGFEQRQQRFPNLRYSAVNDRRTRPQHRAWHGIVRPLSDDFWNTHYPPNGWRCRCTVHQTLRPARGLPKLLPRPPALFQHNAAKTGRLFSSRHPYFRGTPKAMAEEAQGFALFVLRGQVRKWAYKNLSGEPFVKEGLRGSISKTNIKEILDPAPRTEALPNARATGLEEASQAGEDLRRQCAR